MMAFISSGRMGVGSGCFFAWVRVASSSRAGAGIKGRDASSKISSSEPYFLVPGSVYVLPVTASQVLRNSSEQLKWKRTG